MGWLWGHYGVIMGCRLTASRWLSVPLWGGYGVPMGWLWAHYGLIMGCRLTASRWLSVPLWGPYGVPMGWLWAYYGMDTHGQQVALCQPPEALPEAHVEALCEPLKLRPAQLRVQSQAAPRKQRAGSRACGHYGMDGGITGGIGVCGVYRDTWGHIGTHRDT